MYYMYIRLIISCITSFYLKQMKTKNTTNKISIKVCVCVCETLQYAPGGNKVEKAIFSLKVKVKVTRSFTLMSFERVSLVKYAYQI